MPSDLQSGAFDHLATSRKKVPVTGSGAAQSLRPVCVAKRERSGDFDCWRRVRESNPHTRNETPESLPVRRTRLGSLPLRLCPHASPPVGGSVSLHDAGFPPRTSRVAYARRRCDVGVQGHTRSGRKKTKRPGSFAESGPLEFRERQARRSDAAASRTGAILGITVLARRRVVQSAHRQRDSTRERTRAGEGFGVAKGDPAVHDGVLVSFRFRGPRRARDSGVHLVQKIVAFSKRQIAV